MVKPLYEFSDAKRVRKIVVVGDLHGDYSTFSKILKIVNLEEDCLVFLGDYADRGNNGVEIIDMLILLKKKYPSNVIALKGNHEDYTEDGRPLFSPCDLIEEVVQKRGSWEEYFFSTFKPFANDLYLAALIPGEILFVHGGVSSKIKSLDDLRNPSRDIEIDVLWSDPLEGYGEYPNPRGAGVEFGEDVTEEVCRRLGVKMIVRSHEPRKALQGPCYEHDGKVVTVSSTSIYGGRPFVLVTTPSKPTKCLTLFLDSK